MVSKKDSGTFADAMRDVKRIKQSERITRSTRPAAKADRSRAARKALLEESLGAATEPMAQLGEEIAFRRPQVSERVFRKLRRGQFSIEAEIDLHGLTLDEAHAALKEFIAESAGRGLGCVRVIHGKGRRSGPSGPVLKPHVQRWLAQWDAVLAFVSARLQDGGSGAAYVLLARS